MNCTCCTSCNPHLADGLDADTRELLKYNEAAKQRACPHLHVRKVQGGYYTYTLCTDCKLKSPKSKSRPVGCTCVWSDGERAEIDQPIVSVKDTCPIHFYR